ncbi:MAG TPA: DUF4188 domain-containing protein [Polyangiaceae bacterium]
MASSIGEQRGEVSEELGRAGVIAERVTALMDREFVVFLISMRINSWWKIHKWLPVARAMLRMGKELESKPNSGYLGGQVVPGLVVQYWESLDHLVRYARDRQGQHYPAWADFYRRIGTSGDVGIWHETYLVGPGTYECVYVNMPPHGLGRVGKIVSASGARATAKQRVGSARI